MNATEGPFHLSTAPDGACYGCHCAHGVNHLGPSSQPRPTPFPIMTQPPVAVVKPRSPLGRILTAIGILAIGAIVFASCLASAHAPSTIPDIKATVVGACEKSVTSQLKSPSTAKFPQAEAYTGIDPAHYTARGSVDSQNGFGAMIRATWTCTATWDAATQTATANAFLIEAAG